MGRNYLLSVLLLLTTSMFAGDTKIVAIRATGSHEFSQEEIARASGLTINQVIGPAEFKNAADRLASTGAFAQVGYSYGPLGSGMFVEFQVQDALEFLPIRYENFVWSSDDELTKQLAQRVPLFHGHLPPGGALVDETVAAMQSLLSDRGINAKAAMRMHTAGLGKPVDAISLYVDGLQLLVKDLDVMNASGVSAEDVKKELKPLVGTSYDRAVMEDSVRYRLDPLYRSHGFLRAVIDAPLVKLSGDPKNPDVILTIPVHEGDQYKFGKFTWTGNNAVPENELKKTIEKCSTGSVANLPLVIEGAKYANGIYMNRGYLASKVQLMPTFDDGSKIVDYELHIVEGQLFHMGKIQVVGVDPKLARQLESAWKIKPGEVYNPTYENQFIKDNSTALRGRPARTTVTQNQDATVDVKVEF